VPCLGQSGNLVADSLVWIVHRVSGLVAGITETLKRIPMSQGLMGTLARAAEYAQAQQHGEVALEHLLLALTEDSDAVPVLEASHVDLSLLTADVSQYLGGIEPQAVAVLEAAAAAASQGRRREINGAIVLAAIVGDGRSSAAHMLRGQGLTFEEAIKALQRAMAAPVAPALPSAAPAQMARPVAMAPTGPVDSEDILATARQRVQLRAAPGLAAAPARPPEGYYAGTSARARASD
jgi:neural Wiskott-Aldrich syndrome protein